MAEHGAPCDDQEATYCMNGGTCYRIHAMNTLSCVCNENYKGSRCEEHQLFSTSSSAGEAGLIAAVVIVALLILVVLAFVIYYIRKALRAKQQIQQNNQQQYWRVKPRVWPLLLFVCWMTTELSITSAILDLNISLENCCTEFKVKAVMERLWLINRRIRFLDTLWSLWQSVTH